MASGFAVAVTPRARFLVPRDSNNIFEVAVIGSLLRLRNTP